MLLYYIFTVVAALLLTILLGFETCLLLALARFGLPRLIVPYLAKHGALLMLLIKSFRLRKGTDFKIPLTHEDAPDLYEVLGRLCQRLNLALPDLIALQMGDGAWVRLQGVRSGKGKVTLGVGYDLLAGLTISEMEAVFAHEMTHAKLVNRGFSNWVNAGQVRVRTLANSLWADLSEARQAKKSATVTNFLFVPVDRLLRLITKMAATYSRQDEFEADRGAAELKRGRFLTLCTHC